jgi:serine protease Do
MSTKTVAVRESVIVFSLAVVFAVGGLFGLLATAWTGHSLSAEAKVVPMFVARGPVGANDGSEGMGFAPVLKPVLPAVVSIASSRIVKVPQMPFFNDPFFQQFFGNQLQSAPRQQRKRGLGSGVIVSPDGYILTNYHVIEKATDIKVMLADKREFPGKVVGSDPKTDIAVVKIAATGLPTVTFGDSSKLQVGDYAFAIGNPFGVGETATMGIISATGRNGLDIEDYEDFIQTDAAINPGNSGGALVNARGALIGINTAILTGGGGGNQGIGFAIPINMAKHVMDEILKNGKVVRGYIGVVIQEVTPDLAKAFKVPAEKGALVGSVDPDSPGAKAGLQRGDVITELNGQAISGPNDLRLEVGAMTPGTAVHLKIDRSGEARDLTVTLGEAPGGKGTGSTTSGGAENSPMRDVQVQDLTGEVRQQLGLSSDVRGVVVTAVPNGSPAFDAGLQRGDVIEQVNRHPLNSVAEFDRLIREAGDQSVLLLVNRGGNTTFVVVEPE